MDAKTAITNAIFRGLRMFMIAFVAACTTGLSVLQQQLFSKEGLLEWKPALAAASTAFLIAFATSVLHIIEQLFEQSSQPKKPLTK